MRTNRNSAVLEPMARLMRHAQQMADIRRVDYHVTLVRHRMEMDGAHLSAHSGIDLRQIKRIKPHGCIRILHTFTPSAARMATRPFALADLSRR